MLITVNRVTSDHDSTISTVSIDGRFSCFGLEDEYRINKKIGETRIPAGKYKIGVRTEGGFHARYERKYNVDHKGMLQVLDVPGFEYILIHIGNTDRDTSGCLLLGYGCYSQQGNMSLQTSRKAYFDVYNQVIDNAIHGDLFIEYVDNDL